MEDLVLLHIGCGNRYSKGFINSDSRSEWKGKQATLDKVMDIKNPWLYEDGSVDGIVSMHVFQTLLWRELVFALREAFRVLKKGGVMRTGLPTIDNGKPLDYLLGWNNITLLSVELFENVCKKIGFTVYHPAYRCSAHLPVLATVDNRPDQTYFFDCIK